jgi:hypothetical protein
VGPDKVGGFDRLQDFDFDLHENTSFTAGWARSAPSDAGIHPGGGFDRLQDFDFDLHENTSLRGLEQKRCVERRQSTVGQKSVHLTGSTSVIPISIDGLSLARDQGLCASSRTASLRACLGCDRSGAERVGVPSSWMRLLEKF